MQWCSWRSLRGHHRGQGSQATCLYLFYIWGFHAKFHLEGLCWLEKEKFENDWYPNYLVLYMRKLTSLVLSHTSFSDRARIRPQNPDTRLVGFPQHTAGSWGRKTAEGLMAGSSNRPVRAAYAWRWQSQLSHILPEHTVGETGKGWGDNGFKLIHHFAFFAQHVLCLPLQ